MPQSDGAIKYICFNKTSIPILVTKITISATICNYLSNDREYKNSGNGFVLKHNRISQNVTAVLSIGKMRTLRPALYLSIMTLRHRAKFLHKVLSELS